MLPTGHIAAGYLTAEALLKFSHQALTATQKNQLLVWGAFWGFAPDLDVFWFFFKNHSLLVSAPTDKNHRFYISHAPLPWLIAGLLVYFFGATVYIKYIGLLLWLGSWSHFLLDSIEHGIMWLWPLSNKVYALKNRMKRTTLSEKDFFKHTWQFLKLYSTRLSFYLELIVIIAALIIYFR